MKLSDLIGALADEIEVVRPELEQHLTELSTYELGEDSFSDAADFYAEQVERMGEAAEMVGFPGLQHVCEHITANIAQLKETPLASRGDFITFLQKWPDLVVHYLKNVHDPSCAAGLVDCLRDAPVPLEEEEALKTMHALGAFPSDMDSLEEQQGEKRPVLASPDDVKLLLPDDVDPNLLEGFYQEAPAQTEELVNLLNGMVSGEDRLSDLIAAKRIVHTLKGTGAIVGLAGIANLGHHFEDILDYFEEKEGKINPKIATVLLDGGHCLAQMIAYLTGNDEYPDNSLSVMQNIIDIANIVDRGGDLENIYLRNQGSDSVVPLQPAVEKKPPSPTGSPTGAALRVSMKRIDELFRVSAEISVHTSAMEAQLKNLNEYIKRLRAQQLRVKQRLFELETVVDVRSLALMHSSREQGGESFDPLELEQYNELHSTTHALLEEFNDAVLIGEQLAGDFSGLSAQENEQQLLARDLQHLVIGTRMSEVGSLEPRLQRNIRSTSQMTGKQVRLELTGGDTLLDSDVLSQLADPLLHLLRNAIDHGIESPEERYAKGKDPVGVIALDFTSQGQQIFMRCRDDGKGLDYQRILEKAIANQLVSEGDELSKEQIGQLIFNSGLSTRDSVSQVSGRGVGMDVVRNWLNTMNGSVEIDSEPGQFTCLTLNFASSLTTVQSLIVAASGQAFALPSVQIQQALAQDEGEFFESGHTLEYRHNDRVYGAKHLSDMLGFERADDLHKAFAVLMRIEGDVWAIAVDKLIDSRELLLKPPGLYMRHILGIVGTSILGDGSIAIHLDMAQLLLNTQGKNRLIKHTELASDSQTGIANILVVDDSLSVRNTLQELVGDAGFNVKTARDGIEAVNLLDTFTPQVVLTDLEMPNMNGVELTSHIRNRSGMQSTPVIMITSRSQDKHRELAMQAGVNVYYTKPYNDGELLKTISELLV